MLHMILVILKIIGILLGTLLLLLLAVLLAVAFVPLKYRLEAKAQQGKYAFSLRGSWLLHIVSASVSADSSGDRTIRLRLFGIRLPLFGAGASSTRNRSRKRKERGAARREETEIRESERAEESPRESREHGRKESGQRIRQGEEQPEDSVTQEREEQKEQERARPRRNILQKIWFSCRNICDKIRQMTEGVRRVRQKLLSLRERAAQLWQKGIALWRKPGELLEFLEEYEMREAFGAVAGHLLFLLGHYKPRRIEGYLRFGTGDPAATGQLTGLIYLLLPAGADRFEVLPEFNETRFETDLVCSGHIRALHALRVLVRGFRDRKLRRLINKLRKRGDS